MGVRLIVATIALLALGTAAPTIRAQTPLDSGDTACRGLTRLAATVLGDPTAAITEARSVAAGARIGGRDGDTPLPAHCDLFGKLEERTGANGQHYRIRFHMRLPADWNGRFFFGGGGGSNGVVGNGAGTLLGGQPATALNFGFATVTQDSGHDNALNDDPKRQGTATFGWDARARRNYGFASIGTVTHAAKAIIRAYYGKPAAFSYFVGGSKGGQEAFMAAQRFGREFDGVLAGYPGFRLATAATAGEMWDDQAFAAAARAMGGVDADGLPLLGRAFSDPDLALAQQAVLDACDTIDGLRDGMVLAFSRCTTARVRPALARITCKGAKLPSCLMSVQVRALVRVFEGARDARGRLLYATWQWDSGIGGRVGDDYFRGWRDWKIGGATSPVNNARNVTLAVGTVSSVFTSPPTPLADTPADYTHYALGLDVARAEAASRVKWGAFNEAAVDFMNADSVDLKAFKQHGGKLLIFHGVSDPVFSIHDTIDWLERVDRVEGGKASRFVRLFPVPGMNHGGGGPSTDQADFFGALVAWTERNEAPERFVATARAGTAWPGRTRLLCAFPRQAFYVGGDTEQAASFTCR